MPVAPQPYHWTPRATPIIQAVAGGILPGRPVAMMKRVLIATTAAAPAFPAISSASFAAQSDQTERRRRMPASHARREPRALVDAPAAALKAGLKLTSDQEKNWAPLEAAIRDSVKLDDPRFNAPIYSNLFDDRDGDGYSLIRSRSRNASGE